MSTWHAVRCHGRRCSWIGVDSRPRSNFLRNFSVLTRAIDSHLPELDKSLDNRLSSRPLTLDDCGYFIIQIDPENRMIIAEHYGNVINDQGLACDEETGEVIGCGGAKQKPVRVFRGRSAKELSVRVLEEESGLCSRMEHANYLGREFQKAEYALLHSLEYIQD